MKQMEYIRLQDDDEDVGQVVFHRDRDGETSIFSVLSTIFLFFAFVACTIFLATGDATPMVAWISGRSAVPHKEKISSRNITKYRDYYFTQEESQFLNCSSLINGDQKSIALYVNNGRMKLDKERVFELPMDCDSIRQRVYGDMPPFTRLKRPIALVRTIYKMYELQEALFSMSYHPDNVFCYTMDSKSSEKLRNSMRAMSKCFTNVVLLDKEYNMTSGGHGQDPAHFDCLEHILDRKWDHAVILQNFDLIIKSPYQLSEISELLNYTSIMGFENGYTYRYNVKADWTPAGMKLFKNETGVPSEILHRKLKVRKSLNEVILSKIFVKSMFEKLNVRNILKLFDENKYYGVDEMMVQTLYENYLGLEGQMESNCPKTKWDTFTRLTHWDFTGPNGYDDQCKSKWKRHGVCILGVEYLNELSKSPVVIANKVMSTFDFGTIICTRQMVKKNGTGPVPSASWLSSFPQFREMQMKRNGTYDKDKFDC